MKSIALVLAVISPMALMAVSPVYAAERYVSEARTPGEASLTNCRSFVLFASCHVVRGAVAIPSKVQVGDQLSFQAEGADQGFTIRKILFNDEGQCWALNADMEELDHDTLHISPCLVDRPLAQATSNTVATPRREVSEADSKTSSALTGAIKQSSQFIGASNACGDSAGAQAAGRILFTLMRSGKDSGILTPNGAVALTLMSNEETKKTEALFRGPNRPVTCEAVGKSLSNFKSDFEAMLAK